MITFVTNYDDNTRCNYTVYSRLSISPRVELLSEDAVLARLNQELGENSLGIFAMSHGTENELKGQDRNAAISLDNIANFNSKKVFSYACNTSINLGRNASLSGCTWYGYIDLINVPEPDEELAPLYNDIFEYIINNFYLTSCRESVDSFVDNLKVLCESKEEELDTMNANGTYAPTYGAYQSIKQLWSKLQVWLASDNNYIMHEEAPEPILRW
ncbi:hypothetical protein [Photobacterium swingsii]|uniref:hypothetical protein n=1 Tax=Photobacterium swingsii TaxID=680026 RepID=UPI0040679E2D